MKKTANKRLKLKAETVAVLKDSLLSAAVGGVTATCACGVPTDRTCPLPSVRCPELTQDCTAVCGTQTCNVNCTIA